MQRAARMGGPGSSVASIPVLASAVLLAAACAVPGRPGDRAPDRPPNDRYLRYVCADKQELGITFQQQGRRALVVAGGWSHLLPQVQSGSGTRYSDGKVTLRTKGLSAALEEDGRTTYRDCALASKN